MKAVQSAWQIHDQLFFCRLLLACHAGRRRSSSVWTYTSDAIFTKTFCRVDLQRRFQQEQAPKSQKRQTFPMSHHTSWVYLWSGYRVWKLQFCFLLVSISNEATFITFAANSRKATAPNGDIEPCGYQPKKWKESFPNFSSEFESWVLEVILICFGICSFRTISLELAIENVPLFFSDG